MEYEQNTNEDCSKYYLAICLYENIEGVEELVDKKTSLEIKVLSPLVPEINNLKISDKNKYEGIYFNIKNELDEKSYNACIQILNDIFNSFSPSLILIFKSSCSAFIDSIFDTTRPMIIAANIPIICMLLLSNSIISL